MGLLAVAFLYGVWLCDVAASGTPGSSTFSSGPFTITYDSTQTPTLRVEYGGRTVWFTSEINATFATAARVIQDVEQTGGDFVFSTAVQEVCGGMTVTSMGTRSGSGYPQASGNIAS